MDGDRPHAPPVPGLRPRGADVAVSGRAREAAIVSAARPAPAEEPATGGPRAPKRCPVPACGRGGLVEVGPRSALYNCHHFLDFGPDGELVMPPLRERSRNG